MNELEGLVRLAIYRNFAERSRAPTSEELAGTLQIEVGRVVEALRSLASQHIIVLQPDSDTVWMAHPFSGVATDFRVLSKDREWYANCIWDSFGILAALGASGTIRTHCPDCGEELILDTDARISDDMVVHFAVPAARWWDDIGFT
jgi:hypothetical protein